MLNSHQLNSFLLSILLSSSFGTILCAQQATSTYQPPATYQGGQVIQGQQFYQGQGQVIQGQGQVIQGQVIQGQTIQGQPQGQIIQGQPFIQGPVIQGRPIRGNVVQPRNTPQQSEAQRNAVAAARAKIAEQAKSIKTLTAENSRLGNIEDTNNAMRKEYARLRTAYGEIGKELDELKLKKSMNAAQPADTGAQEAKLNQLNAQYQNAVEQNGTMSGQIKLLTQENAEIKNRLKDLSTTGGDMTGLQATLNTANNRITEIGQQNQTLATENNRLQGALQAATSDNEKLNMRISTLSQEGEQVRAEYQAATERSTTLGEQVAELSTQNQNYLASLNSRPADPAPVQAKVAPAGPDSNLVADYDNAMALNADLESKNGLLMDQISELEEEVGNLNKAPQPKDSLLAVALPTVPSVAAPASKFNIMKWLIPFLLLGLTIGLYVFLTEEHGGGVATEFASTTHKAAERVSERPRHDSRKPGNDSRKPDNDSRNH